jgi:Domain of unknown function (DUF4852)
MRNSTIARKFLRVLAPALCVLFIAAGSWAQSEGFDETAVALAYHKLTGESVDFQSAAQLTDAYARASNFDRPDVLKQQIAQLQSQLDSADPSHVFVIRVNDSISEYDHDRGEFSVSLFQPGYYVPMQAFRQQYEIVFANAEQARPIPMPKDQAREFDAQLNRTGRRVTSEIHFRVIGKGDPAGAVTGPRVIRAEIVSARLLDNAGHVLYTPQISASAAASSETAKPSADFSSEDVAGFRVDVKVKDLEATLNRMFGPTRRGSAGSASKLFAGSLTYNDMGCIELPDGRHDPKPGAVCVTALYDGDDVVRLIRIERVFSWLNREAFRRAMTTKYGPVVSATDAGSDFSLGWGPEVSGPFVYSQSGPHTALIAYYTPNDSYLSRGLNSLPKIRIVLQLADVQWASAHR